MRRVIVAAFAVAVAMVGLAAPQARADVNVYTTPGGHFAGGRLWRTSCEMYSSNVVRCRTEIWATQVVRSGGVYRNKAGWYFNNLTYLPSPRSSWTTNPLAAYGVVGGAATWTSAGREWRSECDTSGTGIGACRAYIWSTVVSAQPRPGGGYRFVVQRKWVFNNIVLFSSPARPAVTTIPAHVLDRSRIDATGIHFYPGGYGPLFIGARFTDLEKLGYVRWESSFCEYWDNTAALDTRGIQQRGNTHDGRLDYVAVTTSHIPTLAGARVGMTIGQIKAIYGSEFQIVPKQNYGETQYFGSIPSMDLELQFRVAGPGGTYAPTVPLVDSDVVVEIAAQKLTNDVSFDGC